MECEAGIDSSTPTGYSVLKVDRKLTDKNIGSIFGISFLLWLLVIVHAFGFPVETEILSLFSHSNFELLGIKRILAVIGIVLTPAVLIIAIRFIPYRTMVALVIFFILTLRFIPYVYYSFPGWVSVYLAMKMISIYIFIINLLSTEWFHMAEAVLKEACKMILSVPSTIVFVLLTCLLNAFLIIIIGIVFNKQIKSELYFTPKMMSILINLVIGTWTIVTVFVVAFMTVSGTFAEYYWTENKSRVSFSTVIRLFKVNLRYHIGTAAMCHPRLGSLATEYLVMEQFQFCFFIYNFFFDTIVHRIIMLGTEVMSSTKGQNFYSSVGNTLNIFKKNPRRFLAVFKLLDVVLDLSSVFVIYLTLRSIAYYFHDTVSPGYSWWQLLFVVLVVLAALVSIGTLFICLTAASFSIILCFEEEVFDDLRNTEELDCYAMSSNLYAALNCDGPPHWFRHVSRCCIPSKLIKKKFVES